MDSININDRVKRKPKSENSQWIAIDDRIGTVVDKYKFGDTTRCKIKWDDKSHIHKTTTINENNLIKTQ